ncbi:MAG: hybrid sensor histidine kinase/response regulator [Cyanobacteria bacterium P01_B01_bin.77]
MYIEDEELRTLYRDASKDHLDKLEAGFLYLEKYPDDSTKLKELLRATHSLKGDSRMLGVQDAETLTHQLEDLLSSVEQGERRLTPELCDCLYQGLDAVRKIAHEAITGETANVSVFHVLAQLMNCGEESAEPLDEKNLLSGAKIEESSHQDSLITSDGASVILLPPVKGIVPAADVRPSAPDLSAPETTELTSSEPELTEVETEPIDTIRVEACKLDVLMTQASELAITKRRIIRRIDDIDQVLVFWESIAEEKLDPLGDLLKQLRTHAYEDSAQLETLSNDLASGILKLRQLPLSNLFNLFPRMVRDLAKQQGKTINLVIEGGNTQADKRILEEMQAPLTHLIRNAIDHGIEAPSERIAMGKSPIATVWLKAHQRGSHIEIEVIDDGRGLSLESIKRTAVRRGLYPEADLAKMDVDQLHNLIFAPGFSTRTSVTEISGRGVGLDVVRVNVERLKGLIQVNSSPAQGCTFRFTLNTSLATASALIVEVGQTPYAIPVEFVETMMRVDRQDVFNLEGKPAILLEEIPLSVAWLTDLLDLPVSVVAQPQNIQPIQPYIPCVVLKVGSERLGVFVDTLVDQQDIVLKPHSKLLKRVRNMAGATILGSGDVCMVLSPQDLLRSVQAKSTDGSVTIGAHWDMPIMKPKVLLVEDSIPIRTQVRRILEGAGYQVTTAVDGLDGFEKLQQEESFVAVVSDVEMPNLDGLGLTTRIRQETKYENLPIILVTTLAQDDDKQRGADAGANAYITKGDFDQSLLIHTLRSLI